MIRLEGPSLPTESQGQIVPWLFGDVLLDVPGIPLQIGHAVQLSDNCGVDDSESTWRISGADLSLWLPALPLPRVAQVDGEWVLIVSYAAGETSGGTVEPWTLTVSRAYGGTVAEAHAKGATLTILESRPVWLFAEAPPGLRYPDDAVVALRYNDLAQLPPCTVRLADTRWLSGKRLITAEMDLSKGFGGLAPPAQATATNLLGAAPSPPPTPTPLMPPAPLFGFGGTGAGAGSAAPGFVGGVPVPVGGGFVGGGAGAGSIVPTPPPPSGTTTQPSALQQAETVARVLPNAQAALGRLTADLKGLLDTPDGRYSGTAEAPLIAPDAVTAAILDLNYGETARHATTWTTTRAQQARWGLSWRLIWTGGDFEAFRAQAGLNGLATLWLDDEGLWRYTARPDTPSAITITATITDRELIGELALGFIPPSATRLPVTWGSGFQGGNFMLDDTAGLARYGYIAERSLALAYIATEASARFLGKRWQRPWAKQVATTTAAVAPNLSALTRLDYVTLDSSILDTYGSRRLPWEIRGTTDRGDGRVLVLVEAEPATGLEADAGTIVITGTAAVLHTGVALLADAGTVVITGTDATLSAPLVLLADPGSLLIMGTDADLRWFALMADAGAVLIVGTDADLRHDVPSAGSAQFLLILNGGF